MSLREENVVRKIKRNQSGFGWIILATLTAAATGFVIEPIISSDPADLYWAYEHVFWASLIAALVSGSIALIVFRYRFRIPFLIEILIVAALISSFFVGYQRSTIAHEKRFREAVAEQMRQAEELLSIAENGIRQ